MSDSPKTKTVGHLSLERLAKIKEWKLYMEKATIADKAETEREQAKEVMRQLLKKKLELPEETNIDFSKNGDRLTVTEILVSRQKRTKAANSLDAKF